MMSEAQPRNQFSFSIVMVIFHISMIYIMINSKYIFIHSVMCTYIVLCMQKLHELENKERNMSNLRGGDEYEKEQMRIREKELKEQMVQKVCLLCVLLPFNM